MDAEGLEYHILGDMNVNVNSSNSGSNLRLLTDTADVYGLQQLINEPTRVTSSSSTMIGQNLKLNKKHFNPENIYRY